MDPEIHLRTWRENIEKMHAVAGAEVYDAGWILVSVYDEGDYGSVPSSSIGTFTLATKSFRASYVVVRPNAFPSKRAESSSTVASGCPTPLA
jgi:hypothetical protein